MSDNENLVKAKMCTAMIIADQATIIKKLNKKISDLIQEIENERQRADIEHDKFMMMKEENEKLNKRILELENDLDTCYTRKLFSRRQLSADRKLFKACILDFAKTFKCLGGNGGYNEALEISAKYERLINELKGETHAKD